MRPEALEGVTSCASLAHSSNSTWLLTGRSAGAGGGRAARGASLHEVAGNEEAEEGEQGAPDERALLPGRHGGGREAPHCTK